MPARNVRVDIPQTNHLKMIQLADHILARHLVLGPASPLNDPIVDMATLETQHNTHETKYDNAREFDGFSQAATEQADIALGINEGQTSNTPGTIYFQMTAIIHRLEQFYKKQEEQISTFGFNVVKDNVRGKVTVRVELPIRSPLEMIDLVKKVLKRHDDLSPASPLDTPEVDMAELATLHDTHMAERDNSSLQDSFSQAEMEGARIALGIDKGQNIDTTGTVYNIVGDVRDKLEGFYRNEEEQISTFGFNVVISTTPFPGEEEPTIVEGNINAGETVGIFDELESTTSLSLENTGTVPLTFCRMVDGVSACDPIAHVTVNPSESTNVVGTNLGASGTWLNVTNFDGAITGNFRVVIES